MADDLTDKVARDAARLLVNGEAPDVAAAIRIALERSAVPSVTPPGHGRVRRHVQAMTMQAVGREAYDSQRRDMWSCAEQIMAALESHFEDDTTLLVGRAADGHFDAGVTIHVRLYSAASITEIARALVAHGCEEPTFETADTRFGRFDRIRFTDQQWEFLVTRCPLAMQRHARVNLYTGRPIACTSLSDVRNRIES